MARTAAQRYQDYKEKLNLDNDKYDEFKRRKAHQSRVSRGKKTKSMTVEELDHRRQYKRERKRKQREAESKPLQVKLDSFRGKLPNSDITRLTKSDLPY